MFAYCNNSPVNQKDETGYLGLGALCLVGALAGSAVDYAAQVVFNYKNGLSGVDAWTDVNVGSIVGSAFSGAISAIPGGGFLTAVADSVGSVAIEYGVNSLISGSKIDLNAAGKDIITNAFTDMVTPDFVEVKIPKYIRDIKEEAVAQGIKGTRRLQKYLNFRQVSGILINTFNSDTSSRLVDHHF